MALVVFGDFEWDAQKAEANIEKHGVSFKEASTVFLDLDYCLVRDAQHEGRFLAIGFSSLARLLFVVHCEKGERIRLIGARRATRNERMMYDQRKRD